MALRRQWAPSSHSGLLVHKVLLTPGISFEHVPSLTHLLLPSGVPNSELEGSEVKGLAVIPSVGCCVALRPEAWPHLQGDAWLSSPPGGPSFPLLHLPVLSGLALMSPLSGSLPNATPQTKWGL